MNDATTQKYIRNRIDNSLLCILIPTVVGREAMCEKLLDKIKGLDGVWELETHGEYTQRSFLLLRKPITIIVAKDNKEKTIGEKREYLYKHSLSPYSWQIDDDDDISDNAISLILEAIQKEPDCITFEEHCNINGVYYTSNHALKYEKWQDNFDDYDFVRCPFYKDVIKTEIARSVPFPHIRYNEDEQWSMALRPHLKTEAHINEELYWYIHNSKPENHNERYGIR